MSNFDLHLITSVSQCRRVLLGESNRTRRKRAPTVHGESEPPRTPSTPHSDRRPTRRRICIPRLRHVAIVGQHAVELAGTPSAELAGTPNAELAGTMDRRTDVSTVRLDRTRRHSEFWGVRFDFGDLLAKLALNIHQTKRRGARDLSIVPSVRLSVRLSVHPSVRPSIRTTFVAW